MNTFVLTKMLLTVTVVLQKYVCRYTYYIICFSETKSYNVNK